jgi:hypothetical protein
MWRSFSNRLASGCLIVDSVRLEPSWRGYGLGALLVGMVIEHLGEARQFVTLHAAPTERRNAAGERVEELSDANRHAASVKLGDHWAQLGSGPSTTRSGQGSQVQIL